MLQRRTTVVLCSLLAFAAIFAIGRVARSLQPGSNAERNSASSKSARTPREKDKLPALLTRFRDHTTKLFEKHGMTNIGYWVPTDGERAKNTLIYVLAHESRAAAEKSWDGFRTDPEWIKGPRRQRSLGQNRQQSRIDLRRPDRFLGDQVTRSRSCFECGSRRRTTKPCAFDEIYFVGLRQCAATIPHVHKGK